MQENNVCPCCGRHCDLSEPHCERGREYLRKGNVESGRMQAEEAKRREMRHQKIFSCLSEEEKDTLLALMEKVNSDWERRNRKDNKGVGCPEMHEGRHGMHGHHGHRLRHDCRDRRAF